MRDSLTVEIVRVRQENPEVTTLYFARPFDFMAGQYITVFIEGSQVREGKAYSISSRPHEEGSTPSTRTNSNYYHKPLR